MIRKSGRGKRWAGTHGVAEGFPRGASGAWSEWACRCILAVLQRVERSIESSGRFLPSCFVPSQKWFSTERPCISPQGSGEVLKAKAGTPPDLFRCCLVWLSLHVVKSKDPDDFDPNTLSMWPHSGSFSLPRFAFAMRTLILACFFLPLATHRCPKPGLSALAMGGVSYGLIEPRPHFTCAGLARAQDIERPGGGDRSFDGGDYKLHLLADPQDADIE